ncbi:MAG: IS21 family transposase [Acidobacteriota bacterium]|nr:MAG: IS21 family transposase [Acidobacteriota bacterium]
MDRRAKVELFEEIRREYKYGVGTIKGVAEKFGVHRRMVRQALQDALPPERKRPIRSRPKLGPVEAFIDEILEADRHAPHKQRHTAHRIYIRIDQELSHKVAESTVRRYVRERKREMGMGSGEIYIPQTYGWGEQAQIDWYEAWVWFGEEQQKAQIFSCRSMASGGAFHRAYPRATQQAFLEAHEAAFDYFGGIFRVLRYDNLTSAVRKILRGREREETIRFIAFRSHWGFEASFCTPGRGNEKGGVEGEVGYFRRNHLVPVPRASNWADLNEQLLAGCREDEQRLIGDREQSVGQGMIIEREHLLPIPEERFELAEISYPVVDGKGCVRVRTNSYSTPLGAGSRPEVKILPAYIEVWNEGRLVARHERCYGSGRQVLNLEHYLDVLERKPGALAGSTPLKQWREQGRWPESYDRLWESLQQRLGKQEGTRVRISMMMKADSEGR